MPSPAPTLTIPSSRRPRIQPGTPATARQHGIDPPYGPPAFLPTYLAARVHRHIRRWRNRPPLTFCVLQVERHTNRAGRWTHYTFTLVSVTDGLITHRWHTAADLPESMRYLAPDTVAEPNSNYPDFADAIRLLQANTAGQPVVFFSSADEADLVFGLEAARIPFSMVRVITGTDVLGSFLGDRAQPGTRLMLTQLRRIGMVSPAYGAGRYRPLTELAYAILALGQYLEALTMEQVLSVLWVIPRTLDPYTVSRLQAVPYRLCQKATRMINERAIPAPNLALFANATVAIYGVPSFTFRSVASMVDRYGGRIVPITSRRRIDILVVGQGTSQSTLAGVVTGSHPILDVLDANPEVVIMADKSLAEFLPAHAKLDMTPLQINVDHTLAAPGTDHWHGACEVASVQDAVSRFAATPQAKHLTRYPLVAAMVLFVVLKMTTALPLPDMVGLAVAAGLVGFLVAASLGAPVWRSLYLTAWVTNRPYYLTRTRPSSVRM